MAQPKQVPLREPGKADWKCAKLVLEQMRKYMEETCGKEQGNLETVRRLVTAELVHESLEVPTELWS